MATITVLQPESDVPLARFGPWLTATRASLRVVALERELVPSLAQVDDGLLILGGRMNAFADLPWIEPVKRLLRAATNAEIPVLGICLGHQLLADALGGSVVVGDAGGGEEGVVDLEWLAPAFIDPVLGEAAAAGHRQPGSHHDVVAELPPAAVELARSAAYANQAFRLGSAVGVQFHPEAPPELVAYWTRSSGGDGDAICAQLEAVDADIATVGRAIAEGFARACSASG